MTTKAKKNYNNFKFKPKDTFYLVEKVKVFQKLFMIILMKD